MQETGRGLEGPGLLGDVQHHSRPPRLGSTGRSRLGRKLSAIPLTDLPDSIPVVSGWNPPTALMAIRSTLPRAVLAPHDDTVLVHLGVSQACQGQSTTRTAIANTHPTADA